MYYCIRIVVPSFPDIGRETYGECDFPTLARGRVAGEKASTFIM